MRTDTVTHTTRGPAPGTPRSALGVCSLVDPTALPRLPKPPLFHGPVRRSLPLRRHCPCAAHPPLKSPDPHSVGVALTRACNPGRMPGLSEGIPYSMLGLLPDSLPKLRHLSAHLGQHQSRSPPNSTVRTPFPAASQRGISRGCSFLRWTDLPPDS